MSRRAVRQRRPGGRRRSGRGEAGVLSLLLESLVVVYNKETTRKQQADTRKDS